MLNVSLIVDIVLFYSCWLSVGKGVIWAFAGPVIFIILVCHSLYCIWSV